MRRRRGSAIGTTEFVEAFLQRFYVVCGPTTPCRFAFRRTRAAEAAPTRLESFFVCGPTTPCRFAFRRTRAAEAAPTRLESFFVCGPTAGVRATTAPSTQQYRHSRKLLLVDLCSSVSTNGLHLVLLNRRATLALRVFHRPQRTRRLIQYTVDEFVRLLGAELLGQINRLVDHHLVGDLRPEL